LARIRRRVTPNVKLVYRTIISDFLFITRLVNKKLRDGRDESLTTGTRSAEPFTLRSGMTDVHPPRDCRGAQHFCGYGKPCGR
jgi:hypothetical protein